MSYNFEARLEEVREDFEGKYEQTIVEGLHKQADVLAKRDEIFRKIPDIKNQLELVKRVESEDQDKIELLDYLESLRTQNEQLPALLQQQYQELRERLGRYEEAKGSLVPLEKREEIVAVTRALENDLVILLPIKYERRQLHPSLDEDLYLHTAKLMLDSEGNPVSYIEDQDRSEYEGLVRIDFKLSDPHWTGRTLALLDNQPENWDLANLQFGIYQDKGLFNTIKKRRFGRIKWGFYSRRDAAEFLGVRTSTIQRYIKKKELKTDRKGRIHEDELMRFKEERDESQSS